MSARDVIAEVDATLFTHHGLVSSGPDFGTWCELSVHVAEPRVAGFPYYASDGKPASWSLAPSAGRDETPCPRCADAYRRYMDSRRDAHERGVDRGLDPLLVREGHLGAEPSPPVWADDD